MTPARKLRAGNLRTGPILVLLILALGLAACAKKGSPQPPADEPNVYPRTYPSV